MAMIPVRYIGPKDSEIEHNYGSWVTFKKDEVTEVPDYAAKILIERHPSEYEDARHYKQRSKSIEPQELPPTVKEEEVEQPPLVNLDGMKKADIVAYAHRHFGVELQESDKKSDLIETVRLQMGKRPV